MPPHHQPPAPGQETGPAQDQEQILAIKRRLGERFRAWRLLAGLTQDELAHCTGYKRPTIANAEKGGSRAPHLFAAADRATSARGALIAERNQAAAAIAAIRQQATRRARTTRIHNAQAVLAAAPAAPATTQTATCPHCHHISVMTLAAIPEGVT